MKAPDIVSFDFKEIAEALIKKRGLHDGIWGIYVEFGIQGMNSGPSQETVYPSALVPILKMGLQPFKEVNSLSVDASKVNPKPQNSNKKAKNP